MVGVHRAESAAFTIRKGEMNAAMHGARRLARSSETGMHTILAETARCRSISDLSLSAPEPVAR